MGFLRRLFGSGEAAPPSRKTSYEAAATGRRLSSWQPGHEGANTLLFQDGDMLRSRSRDLVRRNAWAANGVDSLVSNLIGTGIKPQSIRTDPAFNETVTQLWGDWCREADAHGAASFYGVQALAVRAMIEGGEVLVRFRNRRPEDGLIVPFQVQLLEPEHLPTNLHRDLPNGNYIRGGIEFNRIGKRVAYHLYPEHPGDRLMLGGRIYEPVPVPASEIAHLFRPLRPGQIRGEPWLTQALIKLHDLDKYDDAELVRKQTAALIAGFITKPGTDNDDQDDDAIKIEEWSPGTMYDLPPGYDVKFSDPSDVGGQYEVFMRMQLRAVASAIGVTYEQLTGDLTGVNYSSLRAGLVEMRRRMQQTQQLIIIHQFNWPIWCRWMDQAVLSGALSAPGYGSQLRDYRAVQWIPQGWDWVDPLKDIQATIMMIRGGLMTRGQAVAELGFSSAEIDHALAEEQKRADQYGHVFDSDPRKRTKNGQPITDQ